MDMSTGADTNPSEVGRCGGGSHLNPAAPMFFPNETARLQLKLTLNPSFHYYYHSHPPYAPLFSPPLYTPNYNFNPSHRFLLPTRPPQDQHDDQLHASEVLTQPNPNVSLLDQTQLVPMVKAEAGVENGVSKGPDPKRRFYSARERARGGHRGRGSRMGFCKGWRVRWGGDGGVDSGSSRCGGLGSGGREKCQRTKRERHWVVPVQCDGTETTVMIRNIPNKYTYVYMII